MAYGWMPESIPSAQRLAELERGYRRDLQDVAAARASCASLRQITDRDEQELLRALSRIELMQRQYSRMREMDLGEEAILA